jgi:hypothetical protein
MGSSGSGSFTDYSGVTPSNPSDQTGGASGTNRCGNAFSTGLEEVSRCQYFLTHGSVPSIGTDVTIGFNGMRLVALAATGEEIGYLPTKFNYLKGCLEDDFNYEGQVVGSTTIPHPTVTIDAAP